MTSDKMTSRALHIQNVERVSPGGGDVLPATLQSPDRFLPSRLGEKHNPVHRKNTEKSVLDDIMGDPDDFGDMGASDVDSDGGRWEDTLKEMEQCDTRVEESLQRKLQNSEEACDVSYDLKQQKASGEPLVQGLEPSPLVEKDHAEAETFTCHAEDSFGPGITNNIASQSTAHSKRFFIIKSLNYHNIEKSIQKGIWATQAMNERILNEAFENADTVMLIFSVNMSGHFQGYAQMTSPIGRRKVNNVWSEANWGGTFSVEWVRLYDLPFQKTLHLKNPLNSYKPVKISRDCQELTAEIGEALCALLDEGAQSEEYSKRRIHVRSDYFTKKPYMERVPPFDNSAYFTQPSRNQMHSGVYPTQILPRMPGRSLYMKHAGSSSSRPLVHLGGVLDVRHQQKDEEAIGVETSREEDFLDMTYEEYLQFRKNSRESKYEHQGTANSQLISQFGAGWGRKEDMDMHADDPYATYLASWYANQQTSLMHNGYYQTGPTMTSSFRNSEQLP